MGFRFYAFLFGCNLSEVEHDDLRQYKSLGDFFYRRLKEGSRPIADAFLVRSEHGHVLLFVLKRVLGVACRRQNLTLWHDRKHAGRTGQGHDVFP